MEGNEAKVGDVIEIKKDCNGVKNSHLDYFFVCEDFNEHDKNERPKKRIVSLTDFENLEYNIPQEDSIIANKFKDGEYRIHGHISQFTNLRTIMKGGKQLCHTIKR